MLYNPDQKRQIIMKHYTNPQYKTLSVDEKHIEKFGESCSDYLNFTYEIVDKKIKNLRFAGNGCAFFLASTDILCGKINDKEINETLNFIDVYEKLILGEEALSNEEQELLEELMVFDNVKTHYNRVNCCLMLVRPLKNALKNVK
nr:iron-sulfur cluster assembly scaffold protein [Mycoplasmopsis iners]